MTVSSLRWPAYAALMAGCVAVGACSGTSAPPPGAAMTNTATFAVPQTAGTSIALPTTNGHTVTIVSGSGAPPNDMATATVSQSAPPNAPAPSAHARNTRAIANATPFLYVTIAFTMDTPSSVFGTQTVTLNGEPAASNYYMEVDQGWSGNKITTVQGSYSNASVTYPTLNNSSTGVTFLAGKSYLLQFYYVTAGGPSPLASPSASPSAFPSASPSPSSTGSSAPTSEYAFNPTVTQQSDKNGTQITTQDTNTGVSATALWTTLTPQSPPPGGIYTFSQGLALNQNGDITPAGFPTFSQSGQLLITYIKYSMNPEQSTYLSPQLTVTSAFPSNTMCSLWWLVRGTWQLMPVAKEQPSSTTVTFPQTTENSQIIVGNANSMHGSVYVAVSCDASSSAEYRFVPTVTNTLSNGGTIVTNDTSTGVGLSTTWGSSTPGGSYTLSQGLALNQNGDIMPASFPAFTPPSGSTVITYVKYSANPPQTYPSTPAATFTASTLNGKTSCALYIYNGTNSWQTGFVPNQAPSGGSVTFPAMPPSGGRSVNIGNGNGGSDSSYLALVCQ